MSDFDHCGSQDATSVAVLLSCKYSVMPPGCKFHQMTQNTVTDKWLLAVRSFDL